MKGIKNKKLALGDAEGFLCKINKKTKIKKHNMKLIVRD